MGKVYDLRLKPNAPEPERRPRGCSYIHGYEGGLRAVMLCGLMFDLPAYYICTPTTTLPIWLFPVVLPVLLGAALGTLLAGLQLVVSVSSFLAWLLGSGQALNPFCILGIHKYGRLPERYPWRVGMPLRAAGIIEHQCEHCNHKVIETWSAF